MVIDISIYDSVKKLFMSQCFQQKDINNFDVLTSIEVCADENKFIQIRKR